MANIPHHFPQGLPLALFTDIGPDAEPEVRGRRRRAGWWVLGAALIGSVVVALIPSPYVIEQPGPVFDTLGEVTISGTQMPMIQIPSEETFPTEGTLDMLTVSIRGDRADRPNWLEIAAAYIDPSRAVLPLDSVYPPGVTPEVSNEQGRVDMQNSQKEAVAAALTALGYRFSSTVSVESTTQAPAEGELLAGDVILSVNGATFPDVTGLRARIAANGTDQPAVLQILRDGDPLTLELTPVLAGTGEQVPVLGIIVGSDYDFPFEVTIQLDNVGGPSAGMMFALGIIDKLTPGALTGGESIAGTGTISSTGAVGDIGGIRQKLYGARNAGAEWFLAPEANCGDVTGHVPDGLTVVAVETLDDALAALEAISTGAGTDSLPACPSA